MRSKANLAGHPIHPMLIPFPLAFLMGGFVFDMVGRLGNRPLLWQTGFYLTIAGVGMALVAAVPGFVDYFFTVPPKSSARARATRHMLVMLSVVALFFVAWLLRPDVGTAPSSLTLLLEGVGSGMLGIGGWLGGTLAYRNQIGHDIRYAGAGKWKEESYPDPKGKPVAVARSDELEVNQMKLLHIGGRRVVLGRTEKGYVAFDDHCTHRGGSLAGGAMICGTVQCPWHGSQFDTVTGHVKAGPAEKPIKTYEVESIGAEVRVTLVGRKAGAKTAKA